jgi:hypothetical protein
MVIDYFNACTHAHSLGIALVLFGYLLKNTRFVSWKKKEFEDLEYLLVSFRLYFVIVEDNLCISTMYYLLL